MGFFGFMHSWAGRLLRIGAGTLLIWYGLTQGTGTGGLVVAAVGLVAVAAGVVNFCLLGPLFGDGFMGQPTLSK